MNHASLVRSGNQVLVELARVTRDLAALRRDTGYVRAEEKRNWTQVFEKEYRTTNNVTASSRVADAAVASLTAERYDNEGQMAALEVERDFLLALLGYDA